MASRGDIDLEHKPTETLRQNRRRMGDSKRKFDVIRTDGIDAPKPQRDKPINDRAPKTSKAYRGATGTQADFELIMGKTPKFRAGSGRLVENIERHRPKKGRSDSIPSTLHVPIVRPDRLSTPDGRTSFHFSHDSVAKTRTAVVSETTGRVNRPGAAKAHNKYIERDSAVAIDDEVQLDPANDTGMEADLARDPATAVNDNDGVAVANQEPYFDRPLSRSFLRTYRAALGTLLADPDPDPRGVPPGEVHGLRDLPGRDLVHDGRAAEMLVFADEVPVVGRDRAGGAGLRRAGDGDPEGRGRGDGRVGPAPVPARLSRPAPPAPGNARAIAALRGEPANDPRTPDGQGRYIERQEALAIQPDGRRVLFTNIDQDAERRAEFWRLVEEHEYDASPDKMTFTIADNPSFWEAVAKHEKCPANLAQALAVADPSKRLTFETDDNVAMRRFLSTVDGWRDAGAKAPGENPDDYTRRRAENTCKFQDGRGGRVQYRIIGELPYELDVKGRASILETFSREFEKRKLPFVAVMHAPDHTNDDRNWHFHLVYYDRPCRRLTAEDVANTPADPNPKNKVVEPVGHDAIGQWDFAVVERYKTSSREVRQRHPFAQEKVKEVGRQQDWVQRMRDRLAEITNDHLEEAGETRRVDARRHSEMGIHNDPQEHLGTKLANLEAMGIATPKGTSNEERQWTAMQERLEGDLTRRKSVVDQQARKWLQQAARAAHLDEDAKTQLRGNVTRWHQHRTESEEHQGLAENLDQHMARMTSRAVKVRDTCVKHLQAISAGRATGFQTSRMEQLQAKADEAVQFLDTATRILGDEVKLSEECKRNAERERLIADQIELTILRALTATSIQQTVEDERRRRADNDEQRDREVRRNQQAEVEGQERTRRALVKEQMDAWVDAIRAGRRLVMAGRRIVPMEMTAEDRSIVDAINYDAMQSRLAGVKRNQDKLVEDVVKAVRDNPANVVRQRTDDGETHVLVTSSRAQAKAFREWAADPTIREAREQAVARNAEDAARRAADRSAAAAVRREDAGTAPAAVVPAHGPDRTEPVRTPAAGLSRAARDGASVPTPAETRTPRAEAPEAPARGETSVVGEGRVTGRRAEVASRQALNERIVRAVREEARRITVVDGIATLPERHLRAIGAEASDMADPALQKRLVGLATVQAREIKRLTAYAKAHPERLVERDGAIGLSPKAPREMVEMSARWRGEESVDLALRAIRDVAVAPTSRRETPASPGVDVAATPPAPTAPAERTPPAERPATTADRPVAPPPVREPAPPAPAPEEARPHFTDLTPDYELREQARAYAQQQERERRQAAERDQAARPDADRRAGEDPVSRAVRIASEKAATGNAHPLIDEWMQGVRDGMPVADRQALALRVTTERSARERLRDIDRTVARRIREDAEIARASQQPALGLDVDRGPAPRR